LPTLATEEGIEMGVAPSTSQDVDVLVIDDSDIARASMAKALQNAGMIVADLPSPIGATNAISRRGVRVVVLDVNMPSIRGDKLAALFRRNERFAELKIVLVSGADRELLEKLAEDAGAHAVVPQSAGVGALVSVVRDLLKR
jgi:DNA-binding NarL/FixJ family response regulator